MALYPQDAQSLIDLSRAADMAMYRVKQQGRNGVSFYAEQGLAAERLEVSAAEDQQHGDNCRICRSGGAGLFDLTMAFQPIVDVKRKRLFAYEALVRGPAGESAAEVLRQVEKLNRYAFDQACRRTAITTAHRAGLLEMADTGLCINFFPNAVYRAEVCIRATLALAAQLNFPLSRLIFEVSEQEQARDPEHLKEIFKEYQRLGFRTAIDDFGAGQNGLRLLSEFQPDILKLDMDLVRNIHTDPVRRAIVRGIVGVCNELGIQVIGEGVETEQEYGVLLELGIELFQGFYFSRPGHQYLPLPAYYPLLP